jgi:hypothetical protein
VLLKERSGGGTKKRALITAQTTFLGGAAQEVSPPGSAVGDPHFSGFFGIKFDVFGEPHANYSLLVAPAFEVNMQLASHGPAMRFMSKMTILYRGTSFTITPWTIRQRKTELIEHFESLGARISVDARNWRVELALCQDVVLVFDSHHTYDNKLNYLNFEMHVPSCHDSFGGLLGQTYRCKYATEAFVWTRDMEKSFRVPSLESASGVYCGGNSCYKE